jgi:hypothetical protein
LTRLKHVPNRGLPVQFSDVEAADFIARLAALVPPPASLGAQGPPQRSVF